VSPIGNPAAVELDAGLLYVAPIGTTEPTGNFTAQAGPIAGYRAVGYCVDDQTEILTGDGWKRHDQVVDGDEALTLSAATGLAEWQPILEMCRFPGVEGRPMISMSGAGHDSFSTPNHRWLVDRRHPPSDNRTGRKGGKAGLVFTTTETFKWSDHIPCAAPCVSTPTEAKYTDDFVELVGWWITEGTAHGSAMAIYQSETANPAHCASIRRALTSAYGPAVESMYVPGASKHPDVYPTGRIRYPAWREDTHRTCAVFHLNTDAAAPIHEVAPDKVLDPFFIRSLTHSQLRLLLSTCVNGDGWRTGSGSFYTQQRKDRIDAVQMVAVLAGKRANLTYRADIDMWVMSIYSRETFRPLREANRSARFQINRTTHDGMIWCPRTENKTWMARRNGKVYFTGNTDKGSVLTPYKPSIVPIFVEEEYYPIRYATTQVEGMVDFVMNEMTRQNLALACNAGANAVNDTSAFEPGTPGSELAVMIIWESSVIGERWLFRSCIQIAALAIPRAKAPAKSAMNASFALQKPAGAQPFKVWPSAAFLV